MPESEFTGETIATMVIVPLLLLLFVAGFLLLRRLSRNLRADARDEFDREGATIAGVGSWACLVGIVAVIAITWWAMYPWKGEYHRWVPKSGVVETIDSRLVAMEGKFVVKFVNDDQQYGVLDTRAAGVQAGDHLTITCVRRWQWSGTHGYDCNFVSLDRVGEQR